MEQEIKELLSRVLRQQVVIYKKIRDVENKMEKVTRFADTSSYEAELKKEADKVRI